MEYPSEMRYCTECGSPVESGAGFCYACGANIRVAPNPASEPAAADQPENVRYDPEAIHNSIVASLKIAAASISKLITIWVVLSLIMGIVSIAISPYMKDILKETYNIAFSDSQMLFEGLCLIVSGVTAFIASVLLRKLKLFWVCFVSCIVAALISYPGMGGFTGVITAAIGIYMSMAIYRCRPAFE